jgi:GNAT superfamily N-acetyltransferase
MIRPAHPSDWRALRLLLPNACHFQQAVTAFVATDDAHRVIAALAIHPRLRATPLPGPRVDLHVIPPHRRKGIARQLLDTAAAHVRARGGGALYAWSPLPAADPRLPLLHALGFTHQVEIQEGHLLTSRGHARLAPLYQQLRDNAWIPDDARIVPLASANHDDIALLHARHLGGAVPDILARIRGDVPDPVSLHASPVLLVGPRTAGFTFLRTLPPATATAAPHVAIVESTVVDPAFRSSWANLYLKFAGFEMALQQGLTDLLYEAHDRHTDTRKFAKQVGATTRTVLHPYKIL